ncbi:MAG: VCBS repeat-containing protein [Candidatus Aminicenantes bacterium]|nr:VCBS repeat-containing protein [Candidatus Aminicenantes bacterium]
MNRFHASWKSVIFFVLVLTLAVGGFSIVQKSSWASQDQVRAAGKPSPTTCDTDKMCESVEWKAGVAPKDQPCIDCRISAFSPLALLNDPGKQIVGTIGDVCRTFQITFANSNYSIPWGSNAVGTMYDFQALIGQFDADPDKEILTVNTVMTSVGSGKNKVNYYAPTVYLFKNGSTGQPSSTIPLEKTTSATVGRAIIAGDVDGQPGDELVLARSNRIWIYKYSSAGSLDCIGMSPEFSSGSYSLSIGDADGQPGNEILIAHPSIGKVSVLKYLGNNGWDIKETESIGAFTIDCAVARDIDGDTEPEIIAGGNSSKLVVWKYKNGAYPKIFLSENLGGYTVSVDAGDIDDDGWPEVVTAADYPDRYLYVLKFAKHADSTLSMIQLLKMIPDYGPMDVTLGSLDYDDALELFVYGNNGLNIYKWAGTLGRIYVTVYGGSPRIG